MTFLSVVESILTGILITLILSVFKFLKSNLWTPYKDFKQELTMIDRDLVLYSDILTNTHNKKEISLELKNKISDAKSAIRTRGIDLQNKYSLIPNKERCLLCKFEWFKKLPSASEIKDISGELISISNSAITYDSDVSSQNAKEELASVKASTKKIKRFIGKYGKLYEYN